jgi:hypothetical protein
MRDGSVQSTVYLHKHFFFLSPAFAQILEHQSSYPLHTKYTHSCKLPYLPFLTLFSKYHLAGPHPSNDAQASNGTRALTNSSQPLPSTSYSPLSSAYGGGIGASDTSALASADRCAVLHLCMCVRYWCALFLYA